MLKQHWRLVSFIARITDNLIILCGFYLAYALRDNFVFFINKLAEFAPVLFQNVVSKSGVVRGEMSQSLGPILSLIHI